MTRRLAIIAVWLLACDAVWLGLFWGLLQVPESSVWMLTLSALLAVSLVVVAGTSMAGASAAWNMARPPLLALIGGVRHVPATVAAVLLFGTIWWITGVVLDWHTAIAGQIDAWVIARTGRPNARWIHFGIFWIAMWMRWSLGLTLATSLLGTWVTAGPRTVTHVAWLRSALTPTRWLTVTFWLVLLVAIPWQLVDWRPATLSLAAEPWFVAAKLALIGVAMAVGVALVLRSGHGAAEKT